MALSEMSPDQVEEVLQRLLPRVSRPGRYTGGELNSVCKEWDSVQVRLALAFPDLYDLGMSNLGLMVLYDLVNRRPDMLAERVFCPWTDMERAMRAAGLPLYALESKRPVATFDVLGISLPYEQTYTNALNLLDLSGLPVLASDRDNRHPLVIAGGHATFNPEPMTPFIDAFAIGDGEEVLLELLEAVREWKSAGSSRPQLLQRLATMPGVYVPRLYHVEYRPDGTVQVVQPNTLGIPERVRKRITATLPFPPTRPIVPFLATTHDRATVEIMRGCTRGCRFCQAGFVTRPVRERPVSEILSAVDALLANTGHREIALLSLSSSDYTGILELADAVARNHDGKNLSISLPSLRIETASADLMEAVSISKRGGITFAPEAATERLRGVINKMIPERQILKVADDVFSRGWHTIKLYFMIGHPQETLDDVRAIADLARAVLRRGRQHQGRRAQVNLGVSTFVPKPHTPFQWAALDRVERIQAKLDLLIRTTAGRGLELKWSDPEETLIEAVLSRGDRRLGDVIHRAWQSGAKFDGWHEHFEFEVWEQALRESELRPEFYTYRPRPVDEVLPWDHIDTGVSKMYLVEEHEAAVRGEAQPDCRRACVSCGILTAFAEERRLVQAGSWGCP